MLFLLKHEIRRSSGKSSNDHNFKVVVRTVNISRYLQQLHCNMKTFVISIKDKVMAVANMTVVCGLNS